MDPRRFVIMAGLTAALAPAPAPAETRASGLHALERANRSALEPSRLDRFVGGEQVFQFQPGRIYEVWTAPLRVTTLTLGAGESITTLAAGDTVRWQIGQAASGEDESSRAHVLVKPFQRGLSTNLVITTNRRVLHLVLRSGAQASFNAAVSWRPEPPPAAPPPRAPPSPPPPAPAPAPQMLATSFAIVATRRKAPSWTPLAVMTDGARTYIAFPPSISSRTAPVLSLLDANGSPTLANYRQRGSLFIVDGLIDRAQLKLGERQVVRIVRQGEPQS